MKTLGTLSILAFLLVILACDPFPAGKAFSQSAPHSRMALASIHQPQKRALTYEPGHFLEGEPLSPDFDSYGYNYPTRTFRGWLSNYDRGRLGLPPVGKDTVRMEMCWNEAWLSGTDRNGDGKLDRHPGHRTYVGSGAWLTIHLAGIGGDSYWDYFLKIAAVPKDAVLSNGKWKVKGETIGPEIWGCFAVVMEFSTSREGNRCASALKQRFPGFGLW